MKKASIIMAVLACAIIAAAYTNSVPISTNTRAATEKWTAIRFEPALPPTPENAASKFLDGNREWQTVTAPQIGALTNETDEAALSALAAYAAYWPPNATASSWFTYTTNSGAITITGYNGVVLDVVIPDYINGLPVTAVGESAFAGSGITSIGGAGNVVTVGDHAFANCYSLTSIPLPQVQTVGDSAFNSCVSLASVSLPKVQTAGNSAFNSCASLASVSLPQVQTVGNLAFYYCISLTSVYFNNDAPTIGYGIFGEIPPNQVTNYVTNPQATGWGATLGGRPVVRLPLYADAIYQAGELVATTQHVAQASLADADGYTTQMVMRVGSEITTNRWGPRVTLPDGIVTNGQSGPLTLGGVKLDTNKIEFTNDDGSTAVYQSGGSLVFRSILGQRIYFFNGAGFITGAFDPLGFLLFGNRSLLLGDNSEAGLSYNGGNLEINPRRSGSGDVRVTAGNLTVAGTNTAAEVRSLGGYSIFDSGSNCDWRVTASNGTFYASDTNGVRKFKFTTETP